MNYVMIMILIILQGDLAIVVVVLMGGIDQEEINMALIYVMSNVMMDILL